MDSGQQPLPLSRDGAWELLRLEETFGRWLRSKAGELASANDSIDVEPIHVRRAWASITGTTQPPEEAGAPPPPPAEPRWRWTRVVVGGVLMAFGGGLISLALSGSSMGAQLAPSVVLAACGSVLVGLGLSISRS